jgi:bacillolysin
LGYYSSTSEAKALNEGFSDIWGACVEYWEAPQKSTWLHGEEIFSSGYSCVRNLENPNDPDTFDRDGPHPDTYEGDYWSEEGNAHQNSTVLSHWFYLLSEGDTGTNDNDDAYAV